MEERAAQRYQKEKSEFDEKMEQRAAKEAARGKKLGGKPPQPPVSGPNESDQINLTDSQSRIMPVSGGGFEQAYNAQAAVDTTSMLIVSADVTQAVNDKEQIAPLLVRIAEDQAGLGKHLHLIADCGYCSEANILACEAAGIEPLIAARTAQSWHARTIQRAYPLVGKRIAAAQNDAQTEDSSRACSLCFTQANRRTRIRHHQVRHGISSILNARYCSGAGRMEFGLHGVELETHGRIAPKMWKMGVKSGEKQPRNAKNLIYLIKSIDFVDFYAFLRLLESLSPTGC